MLFGVGGGGVGELAEAQFDGCLEEELEFEEELELFGKWEGADVDEEAAGVVEVEQHALL